MAADMSEHFVFFFVNYHPTHKIRISRTIHDRQLILYFDKLGFLQGKVDVHVWKLLPIVCVGYHNIIFEVHLFLHSGHVGIATAYRVISPSGHCRACEMQG